MLPKNVILPTPNGRFTLRGSVSIELCDRRPATEAAVLGCRAIREGHELVEYNPISRDTLDGLLEAAGARGFHWVDEGGPQGRLEG